MLSYLNLYLIVYVFSLDRVIGDTSKIATLIDIRYL